ncbi:MAG: hypothetical protein A2Z18_06130 [Armatimonadetes bacterium RBG_16_58_9]|nr:MAG: hypothetical protein A2Z18_06130 [Armatimonadetes bacterium RBG_16_58_9]
MNKMRRLEGLFERFARESVPEDLSGIIAQEIGVELKASYLDIPLKNPILVAPGQLTLTADQVRHIKRAGFAGCVIKSVVGEGPDGCCSMAAQRKKPTYIRSFYDRNDADGERPIIHWDGRCDARPLDEYVNFALDVGKSCVDDQFAAVASILCHLPLPGEDFREDEWAHTTRAIYDAGYSHIEIDFCPFLSGDDYTKDQRNVLRWYRTCPGLVKSVTQDVRVMPKLLNLEWGADFQFAMAEAAVEGGADGLVVGNRMFKPEYGSGHGGPELRRRNLAQISRIREHLPGIRISATGGVYSGRDAFEYMEAGADNVQMLSYIMGKVGRPFTKTSGNKFDKVLHKIILDPRDGLVASMLNKSGMETSE